MIAVGLTPLKPGVGQGRGLDRPRCTVGGWAPAHYRVLNVGVANEVAWLPSTLRTIGPIIVDYLRY